MRCEFGDHPLFKMFSGMIEQVFYCDVGICDTRLTEYLSRLLTDFVHIDRIYCMRTVDGEVIREVSRIQADARLGPEVDRPTRERIVNRYIGDLTLFWTGVYPESLRARRQYGSDRLREYLLQGKRSYNIASELSAENDQPPAVLLRNLSEQFEYCVHGLHRVRATWEDLARQQRTN